MAPLAVITLQIPQDLLDEIGEYATQHNLSRVACIREAIAQYLGKENYKDKLTPEERAARRAAKQRQYQHDYRARNAVTS